MRAGAPEIAEMDDIVGLAQAADAHAVDAPLAAAAMVQGGAELTQRRRGRDHIGTLAGALDGGFAHRQCPQHQGAVRDRLVARQSRATLETGHGRGLQLVRGMGTHRVDYSPH